MTEGANRTDGRDPRCLSRILRTSLVAVALIGALLTSVAAVPAGATDTLVVTLTPPDISVVSGSTAVSVAGATSGGTVTITVAAGGGTVTGGPMTADIHGDASGDTISASGDTPSAYTVTATETGLGTGSGTATLTEVSGSAYKLAFATEPSGSATLDKAFGTQPAVAVEDFDGNVVTGSPTSVTLALTTPNGATLSCMANPVTAANSGVATFTGCAVNLTGTFTLTATATGLSSAVSSSFTVGGATSVTFLPSSAVAAGSSVTYTVSVAPVSGSGALSGSVTFVVNSVASSGCTDVALSSGIATCTITFASPGSYTVTATYGSDPLFATTSASLTQVVAGATKVVVKASSPRKIRAGTTITYTASVDEVTGFGSLSGSVSYAVNNSDLSGCTDLALTPESPTCTITFSSLGRFKVTATYANDPIFASSSASVNEVVLAAVAPKETDTVHPSLVAFGSQAILRIYLYGRRGTVSGKVAVTFAGKAICSAALVRGRASCAVDSSELARGENTLVIFYNGKGLYLSSSKPVVVNVS